MKAVVIASNLALDYVAVPGKPDKYGRTPITSNWLGIGSKGGNVFRALQKLDTPSMLIGLIGTGVVGSIIAGKIEQNAQTHMLRALHPDSRINIIIPPHQLLSAPNPHVQPQAKEWIRTTLEKTAESGDILVITGSHPQGITPDDLISWIQAANWGQIIVDQKGKYLRRLANTCPHAIFKINHREYEDIMDLKLPTVIVTMGSGGATMLIDGKPSLKVEISTQVMEVNPIGAGDVFTASLIASIMETGNLSEEALLTAVARAAASVEHLGVSVWDEKRSEEIKAGLILHHIP